MQENKQEKSPIKRRILEYLENKGITKYAFYKESGVSRGVLDQPSGITEDNIARFLAYAQDISYEWLLTGRGEIFKAKSTENLTLLKGEIKGEQKGEKRKVQKTSPNDSIESVMEQVVPVFEVPGSVSLLSLLANKYNPTSYLSLPNLPKCDGAIRMWGDAMEPEMKRGDLLVYKRVKDLRNGLFLGQIYIVSVEVEGEEYVFVQYIEQSDQKESVRLVSKNERFPPRDVPLNSIKALAMVRASIRYTAI